jgi:hypothetical protein
MKNDCLAHDSAQPGGFAGDHVDLAGWARGASGSAAGTKMTVVTGYAGFSRSSRLYTLRWFVFALALLPARVSLCNNVAGRQNPTIAAERTRAIQEEPLVFDYSAHLAHSESQLTGHSEKVPALLRKHSHRPSPSDDDGTCPDPTDEDESAVNILGGDGTEGVVAVWSPALFCFVVNLEEGPSLCSVPSFTPLFLVLQRFRC